MDGIRGVSSPLTRGRTRRCPRSSDLTLFRKMNDLQVGSAPLACFLSQNPARHQPKASEPSGGTCQWDCKFLFKSGFILPREPGHCWDLTPRQADSPRRCCLLPCPVREAPRAVNRPVLRPGAGKTGRMQPSQQMLQVSGHRASKDHRQGALPSDLSLRPAQPSPSGPWAL